MRVMIMKKSEYISFRADLETKKKLAAYAEEKKWSVSQLVELIVQDWVKRTENNEDDK